MGSYLGESGRREAAKKWLPVSAAETRYDCIDGEPVVKAGDECTWGDMPPFILSNGDITTCCYDYDGVHSYANLRGQSLKEILLNNAEVRNRIRRRAFPLCKDCQITSFKIKSKKVSKL